MSYVATTEFVGQTMDEYRRVRTHVMEEAIDGLIVQTAGVVETGIRVVGVWESRADHDRFVRERLVPSFERLGPPPQSEFSDFTAEDVLRGPGAPTETPASPPQLLAGAPDASNRMYAMIMGYWTSQVAGTLARLRIPDRLAAGPRRVEDLAAEADVSPDALSRLLRAAASVGILSMAGDRTFSLTSEGASMRSDVPGSLRGLACTLTAPAHWLPWGHLDEAVRTGASPAPAALGAGFFEYLFQHRAELDEFNAAMEGLSALIITPVVQHLDLMSVTSVVDVGGGSGSLLVALLEANPPLHGMVLERPEVAPAARELLASRGLAGRGEVVEGDFFTAVPEADVYILKLVIHDWDDRHAARILRNCARAMRPQGKVVLIEAVMPDDLSSPLLPLLNLHMHVILGGRERTATQYQRLLEAAGLRLDRIVDIGSHARLIEASQG